MMHFPLQESHDENSRYFPGPDPRLLLSVNRAFDLVLSVARVERRQFLGFPVRHGGVEQDGRARISLLRQAIMDGATEWIRTIVATHLEDDLTARLHKRHDALGAVSERSYETDEDVRYCGFARRAEHDASAKRLRL